MKLGADIIVIGSGPAGVSASWPLVEAGRNVLMLDQGVGPKSSSQMDGSFLEIRRQNEDQWRLFLGDEFYGLKDQGNVSPKLKVPASAYTFEGFSEAYKLQTDSFMAVGSLATGGLSNAWGAGAYAYDDRDLKHFPVSREDLTASFKTVADRIGISGKANDDMGEFYGNDVPLQAPVPLHENTQHLVNLYSQKIEKIRSLGLYLGLARNAVLSEAIGSRSACTEDNMCLWGCSKGAIYSAAQDIDALMERDNFNYQRGCFVQSIQREGDEIIVRYGSPSGVEAERTARAKTVVLAAGTIGSTKLAMQTLGYLEQAVELKSNPAFAMAFCLPRKIGNAIGNKGFSLGQLGFRIEESNDDADYAHGVIFSSGSLLTSEIARYLPLSRPASISFLRRLMPSLVFLNCFLPGSYSSHKMVLSKSGELQIQGGYQTGFIAKVELTRLKLSRGFRQLGAYALPGGAKISEPGSDIHYAGTLPMGGKSKLATDAYGQLSGVPGLYVVDGAVLPQLAAKNPTFTIMANADRIGRYLLSGPALK
jgi:choline dehydrogenase-like flavoprotein